MLRSFHTKSPIDAVLGTISIQNSSDTDSKGTLIFALLHISTSAGGSETTTTSKVTKKEFPTANKSFKDTPASSNGNSDELGGTLSSGITVVVTLLKYKVEFST